ncbi:hypothetical protein FACS189451_05630 [Bacteroidia bacterium]|nr:hypothetical protein FACS189451_05630 [Bacteroidia bacterium]
MRRPEPVEKRFEKAGSNLVAEQNDQRDCQKNTNDFFQILFIDENKQEAQVKKNPRPFIGIEIEKMV